MPFFVFGQKTDTIKINSKFFNQEREVLIHLPAGYEMQPDVNYDVYYVFDAQAIQYFDMVHSTLPFYNNPAIVVGIISPFDEAKKQSRNSDLLPKPENEETVKDYGGYLGNADNLLSFIKDELTPYLDKNYRTLPVRIGIGHSNGGTFISYFFLKYPDFFKACILISPNYEYDKEQLVKRFDNFNFDKLSDIKFFYLSNANEAKDFGKEWGDAHIKVSEILQVAADKDKLTLVKQDFSATENHGTVFPIALVNALQSLTDSLFSPKSFLKRIERNEKIYTNADRANGIAYEAFYKGDKETALKIILWANKTFPENLNIYDSVGEIYQNLGDKQNAYKYYHLFEAKLEELKPKLLTDEYQRLKVGIKDRLNYLDKH